MCLETLLFYYLQNNNKNISSKIRFEIFKKNRNLRKLSKINTKQYLFSLMCFVFLGVNHLQHKFYPILGYNS
jgi:hypothetical protein